MVRGWIPPSTQRRYRSAMLLVSTSAFRLLLSGLALILASGPLHRWGVVGFRPALALVGLGGLLLAIGAGLGVATLVDHQRNGAPLPLALVLILVPAVTVLGVLAWFGVAGLRSPAIHDLSTDLDDAPAFVAVLPHRTGALNPPEHGGAAVASRQRAGYPGLGPLVSARAPAEVHAAVVRLVGAQGWTVHGDDSMAGVVEATATTRWFGFADDVVIRVRPGPGGSGSRVDMRSKSRVGRSDLGTNARRISDFLDRLRAELGA